MMIDALRNDVRDSLRFMKQQPLTSLAAIVTLAIGIGVNAAVFTVFDWILLRPLPYPAAQQLVRVFTAGIDPVTEPADLTYSEFTAMSRTDAFRATAAFSRVTRVMSGPGIEPAHIDVARVSGDFFGVFGIAPRRGRAFTHDETSSGAAVAIVSEHLWRSRLASDESVVGRPIFIDGQSHTIVGVMPPGLGYPSTVSLWRPLTTDERADDDRENVMIARLRSDSSADSATLATSTIASAASKGARTGWADELQRTHVRDVRAALTALLAATALILVMACGNVAALIGARAADRAGEIAVRGALGASRNRILQQLLIQNVVLAALGGVAGLLLGVCVLELLVAVAPAGLPRLAEISLDARIVVAGIAATLVVGLLIGLVPALRASHQDLLVTLAAARHLSGRKRGGALVAVQAAIAVVLVAAAALLGRSLQNLIATDHGFTSDRLVAIDLYLRGTAGGDVRQLYRDLIEAAEAIPAVRSAAIALRLPTQVAGMPITATVDGATLEPASVVLRPITPRYFETAGIAKASGRAFTGDDRQSAAPVGIVNQAFVRDVLRGGKAIGTMVRTSASDSPVSIVGVVADVTPAGEADRAALYVPQEQMLFVGGSLLVRTSDVPEAILPAITTRLRAVAPALPLDRILIVADSLADGRAVVRFNTQLAALFASLAVLLAAIGIYGLTAGEVTTRWRELALRVALGASMRVAFADALRRASAALAIGVVAGIAATLAIGRWMGALLYGVTTADPATLVGVPLLFAAIGLLAGTLAARVVLRLDPAAILRQ